MDWGGLLGSMVLGGAVGYSEGALDEIHRDTAMEERRALFDMQKELRQMDIDAEDTRLERTQEFTRGENALTRDQAKALAEGGWEHSETLADKSIAGQRGLLELGDSLKSDDFGRELEATIGVYKKMGFSNAEIKEMVGGKKGGLKDRRMSEKDALESAYKMVMGEDSGEAPTTEQRSEIEKTAAELMGGGSDGGVDMDAIKAVFSAPDEKTARAAFENLSPEEQSIAKELYAKQKADDPSELRKDKSPLSSSPTEIDMGTVRITRDNRVLPHYGDKTKTSHRYGDIDAGYDW